MGLYDLPRKSQKRLWFSVVNCGVSPKRVISLTSVRDIMKCYLKYHVSPESYLYYGSVLHVTNTTNSYIRGDLDVINDYNIWHLKYRNFAY